MALLTKQGIACPSMRAIIIYGSTYGDTADAAEQIAQKMEQLTSARPVLADVSRTDAAELERYDVILVGCSTWNIGELQVDWQEKLPELDDLNLAGKLVAFFGVGDQLSYPDTFQDALGILVEKLEARGAKTVGLWPATDYDFDASLALRGDHFVGLTLDYTCQMDKNEGRIAAWTAMLVEELAVLEASDIEPVTA